uniref:Uncharacterized protein n=1 Tax=Plectus sambesii TaxID=2011161 RepID=A0A914XV37_9BILA
MDFTESYLNRCSNVGLACRVGDCESLRRLLESGAPADVRDNRGWYPVHEAAYGLHADCINLLIRHVHCERSGNNMFPQTITAARSESPPASVRSQTGCSGRKSVIAAPSSSGHQPKNPVQCATLRARNSVLERGSLFGLPNARES